MILTRDCLHLRQTVAALPWLSPAPALVSTPPRPSAALRVVLDLISDMLLQLSSDIVITFKLAAVTIHTVMLYEYWILIHVWMIFTRHHHTQLTAHLSILGLYALTPEERGRGGTQSGLEVFRTSWALGLEDRNDILFKESLINPGSTELLSPAPSRAFDSLAGLSCEIKEATVTSFNFSTGSFNLT